MTAVEEAPGREKPRPAQPRAAGTPWPRSVLVLTAWLGGLLILAVPTGGVGQLLDAGRLLDGEVDAASVVSLIQIVLWGVWLQLASCTVVETVSALRGVGMPARVPYALWRQQFFVRRHVAAIVPTVRRRTAEPAAETPETPEAPETFEIPETPEAVADDEPPPDAADPAETSLDVTAAREADQVKRTRPQHAPTRWDLADASLLAAGLLDALADRRRRHRQRRPVGEPVPRPDEETVAVEVAAHLGADSAGAGLLDRALRHLAASLAAAGLAPVRLLAARVTPAALELVLESARHDLPAPWSADDSGRRWTLPRTADVPVVAAGAPAPALVCLGGDGVGRVLVDLEAAQGVVCVAGDFDATRSVVVAAALELITARWADEHTVTLVGFGDTLSSLGGRRVHCAATLDEVVEAVTDRLEAGRELARSAGVDLPELRVGGHPAARPEIVVLARPPREAELAELTEWFLRPPGRAPLSILVAGAVEGATWHLDLDADGVLMLEPLDHRVGAQAVSPRTYAALGAADDDPPDGDGLDRPYDPAAVRVLIRLFGTPEASGDVGPGDPVSLEIAAYLALRDSASFAEVGAAVWPAGVSDEERNAAVRRARWWLGLDAAGEPRLAVRGGRLALSAEVQTDWAAALGLPPADPALRAAPGLLRGEPVTPWPDGRFAWLAAEPLAHRVDALVADRCALAASNLLATDDRAAAAQLLLAGLRVCPHATALWLLLDAAADPADRETIRTVRDRRLAALRF